MPVMEHGPPDRPANRRFDVCNGDADGLCAVVQWRLQHPEPSSLVTGLKREIELLARVQAGAGDEVLVCDVSMDRNRAALDRLLAAGARVRWFDHHAAHRLPSHPGLEAHVEGGHEVCSSLLMDRHLQGRLRAWALVGAYGDNLGTLADRLALGAGLDAQQRADLRWFGEAINYNAYGERDDDVYLHPAKLYPRLVQYADPLRLLGHESWPRELDALRRADLQRADDLPPHWDGPVGRVLLLPDAAWSRRVSGGLANQLALTDPARAHAVLTQQASGGYRVSVRAPLDRPMGAHSLCERFGGGGRAGAAGIDHLGTDRLDAFVQAFAETRWGAG
jgi:hypothetical protein